MKYRILIDCGYEGWRFWDNEDYEDIDEAVKKATQVSNGSPFLIVSIIDWKATTDEH